ncbi:hypothetical protein LTR48_009250, partial [Friedmanniomyces endolithicus]
PWRPNPHSQVRRRTPPEPPRRLPRPHRFPRPGYLLPRPPARGLRTPIPARRPRAPDSSHANQYAAGRSSARGAAGCASGCGGQDGAESCVEDCGRGVHGEGGEGVGG